MASLGSVVAKKVFETNGAKIATKAEIKRTIKSLIKNEALIYSFAFSCSPRAVCVETKLTEPVEIPISATEEIMTTKFKTAEKIPNSAMLIERAAKRVNKNPQKADPRFPAKRIKVSFAVAEKSMPLAQSIYLFITSDYRV
jgi:hypothetical protein